MIRDFIVIIISFILTILILSTPGCLIVLYVKPEALAQIICLLVSTIIGSLFTPHIFKFFVFLITKI